MRPLLNELHRKGFKCGGTTVPVDIAVGGDLSSIWTFLGMSDSKKSTGLCCPYCGCTKQHLGQSLQDHHSPPKRTNAEQKKFDQEAYALL